MNFKTILACAAFLTGMVFFNGRLNAAVESDIVGYTTIEAKVGYNLLGVPFGALNEGAGVALKDFQGDFSTGDQIQYWTGSDLAVLRYIRDSGFAQYPDGWYTSNGASVEKIFNPGDGFWLKVAKDTVVTISGRVVDVEEGSIAAEKNLYTLIGPSRPKEYKLADIVFENVSNGDQIQYWTGNELTVLRYIRDSGFAQYPDGWYTSNGASVDKTFAIGEGFWLLPKQEVTVRFN